MKTVARLLVGAIAALGVTGASADVAYVAHPDPAGTETFRLASDVVSYTLSGKTVTLITGARSCRSVEWSIGRGSTSRSSSCAAATAVRQARSGTTSVELRAGADDTPDRLVVTAAWGRRSWPLPERAFHVAVDRNLAVFSTRTSRELYAIDLTNGQAALIAPSRRFDTPRLNQRGVVFRDNMVKRREDDGTTLMKFIPRRHLVAATRGVGRALTVKGAIADLAMDGSRVALAVRGEGHGCDAVVYWNVTWRYAIPITEDDERTCAWSRQGATIESVSIAGLRAGWVVRAGDEARLVSASSVDCFERLVVTSHPSHGEQLILPAGDAGLLSYLVTSSAGSSLGKLDGRMRGRTIAAEEATARFAAVDGGQIAIWRADGTVALRTSRGVLAGEFQVGGARALSLRGPHVVVLTDRGTVDTFDSRSGVRVSSWRVPSGLQPRIDAHFGVAVVTGSGGAIYALSLASGKIVTIARAGARSVAQIEAPGVAYTGIRAGQAYVGFVQFSRLEVVLGRPRG